jgi:hypothetical protein
MELLVHDLDHDAKSGLFTPHVDFADVDARILLPIAVVVLEAVELYIKQFFSPIPATGHLVERIESLLNRTFEVDAAHEKVFSVRKGYGAEGRS